MQAPSPCGTVRHCSCGRSCVPNSISMPLHPRVLSSSARLALAYASPRPHRPYGARPARNLHWRHAKVTAMKDSVALMRTEEGFSVSCAGLPGCWSQGAAEEEALPSIQDEILDYVEVARQLAGEQNLREVELNG